MDSLISVIVPVYQAEKYLPRCVDSICGQTYKNLEIILVDDGSRDRSLEICREYAIQDSRILVIHKENGGVGSARNAGFQRMTGDYLMMVDSDDYIRETMAEDLLQAMKKGKADMAIGGFEMIYDEERGGDQRIPDEVFTGTRMEFINRCLTKFYDKLLMNNQNNKMYSVPLIKENQITYDESMSINEDLWFCMKMLQYSKRIVCLPQVYLYYWQYEQPQSLVTGFYENGVETCFRLLEAVWECLSAEEGVDLEVENQMNNRMIFHLCGFVGLAYYRSSWTKKRCYEEVCQLADHKEFQELLKETKTIGWKNRIASFLLKYKMCSVYHIMCLFLYRKQMR